MSLSSWSTSFEFVDWMLCRAAVWLMNLVRPLRCAMGVCDVGLI